MEAYTGFAQVYDTFMDNVPYDEWTAYLKKLLDSYGVEDGLVLELGCGTGNITERLAELGYDMIGVDNADDMLQIAMDKNAEKNLDILYLLQDMREFELYGTVRAIVSICDSINYITDDEDLIDVFKLVNNYLDPNGIFIFDFNTVHKYRDVMGEQTIAETRDDCSFIWDNYFYEEDLINEYELTLFVKDEELSEREGRECCEVYRETHYQKGYTLEDMKRLIKASGLIFEAAYDAFTKDAPTDQSERIYCIAREHVPGKKGRED